MKKVLKIIVVIICLLVIARIVYVNIAYPAADIKIIDEDEIFDLKNFSLRLKEYDIYSKEEWKQKLENENIELEEEKYNVIYNMNLKNNSNYDYIVTYDPSNDYKVLVVDLEISNLTEEVQKMNINSNFSVLTSLNKQGIKVNNYYSGFLNSDDYLAEYKPNETRELELVYITNEKNENFVLEVTKLGRNQRMTLNNKKK
ncbi:MAG: hypothetical protein K6F41_09035 [Lachnospira sp.]|nr:hypothetical protein [Lachnospira sp.]